MKYLERIGLINTIGSIAIATLPFLLTLIFKWNDFAKTKTEQVLFILLALAILIVTFFLTVKGKKIAKIAGFVYGYFYNFIYELTDLINDDDANIEVGNVQVKTAKGDRLDATSYNLEYPSDQIKLLIILPNDIYAQYRFAELLTCIFDKAKISPAKNGFYSMREKSMSSLTISKNGKETLLLIDTPPTTMRAVKLYRESLNDIDHNNSFEELETPQKKLFVKVYSFCNKNVMPIFKTELADIIKKISKNERRYDYNEMIKIVTLESIIKGVIDKGEFENLKHIGDNKKPKSEKEKQRVIDLIKSRKQDLLNNVIETITA
jgi:hypothetical protein